MNILNGKFMSVFLSGGKHESFKRNNGQVKIKKDIDAFSENSDRHPTSDIYLLSSFWSLVF